MNQIEDCQVIEERLFIIPVSSHRENYHPLKISSYFDPKLVHTSLDSLTLVTSIEKERRGTMNRESVELSGRKQANVSEKETVHYRRVRSNVYNSKRLI